MQHATAAVDISDRQYTPSRMQAAAWMVVKRNDND
jgi:hypothetical protein